MAVVSGRGVDRGRAGADVASGRNNNDVSQREDLANFISMITRDETPFMSSIGKTKATAIYHEWQTDELQKPGNSRISEGTDYVIPGATDGLGGGSSTSSSTGGVSTPSGSGGGGVTGGNTFNVVGPHRSRLGNYTQINGKTIAVSGTRRAIDQAGVADEYAYQLKKRGTELRRDVEFDLVHSYNVAASSGQRSFGGFQSWINDERTVNFAGDWSPVGAANRGVGTATLHGGTAVGDDDKGALSLSDIDGVMQKIYEEGGKATKIMLSPKLRRDFSDLMVTDSGVRRNIDMDGKLRQSVDIYMSDFGDLMVVPNYVMGLSHNVQFTTTGGTGLTNTTNVADFAALIYDPQWFALATLRPLQEVDVGQRGDSTIGMMVEECTLEVKNPIGCGAIYGLE